MALGFIGSNRGAQDGYSGTDSYKYIDRLIKNGRGPLRIVSPYLGPYYAKMLVAVARHRKVYVITSPGYKEQSEGNENAVRILQNAGVKRADKALIAFVVVVLAIAVGLMFYQAAVIIALTLITVLYMELFRKKYPTSLLNLHIKVVTGKFIHEKLYISDSEVIVGSANLTYSGTHKNVEHIEIMRDSARIKELSDHFTDLWNR
jgi:phosphatidylserine/phosphatidylglycerophosphate/cardiolipin synthase-like enzyme